MHPLRAVARIFRIITLVPVFVAATVHAGSSQSSIAPTDVQSFLNGLTGQWVGTVDQSTDKEAADTKYFHALFRPLSPGTCAVIFEYYRLDKMTRAPEQIGETAMTIVVNPDGSATNTICGNGEDFIDPQTSRHEDHNLSEILRMAASGSLEGRGSGKINVSGIALDAGRNGKVSDYSSTWATEGAVFSVNEQFRATFRALIFTKHYDFVYNFRARRGSDIAGLMRSAEGSIR